MADGTKIAVELVAQTTKFEQDVKQATGSVEKAVGGMRNAFGELKGVLATLGVGISVGAFVSLVQDITKSAEALGDLADATGSTVEDLSRLSNQAKIAGADFADFEAALLKFTTKLGRTDADAKAFNEALRVLGVTSKDPAQALQQVVTGLDKFANSATKAAYAKEIFDKSGPRFLATLSDMARLQEVGATTTAKQAEEAEKLEQSIRRLTVEATGFRNAILSSVVPALNDMIERFRLAREAGEGFFASFIRAGTNTETLTDQIKDATEALAKAKREFAANQTTFNPFRIPETEESVKQAEAKLRALLAIQDQLNIAARGGLQQARKVEAPPLPDGKKGAEKISDAQRYLDNLQQQIDKTRELGVVEQVLLDIQRGRLKGATEAQRAEALYRAEVIDMARAAAKETEDQLKLRKEEAQAREKAGQLAERARTQMQAEVTALAQSNQTLREETELIGKDAASIQAINQARLDHIISLKEQELLMARNADNYTVEAGLIENQINLLKQRKAILADRALAEQMAEQARAAKEFNDIFVYSFADGVTEVVMGTRSISDAFKDMERNIVASISRIAAQRLAESLFGAPTSSGGGGIAGGIGGWLNSLFSKSGGSAPAWTSGFDLAFANGGAPPVGRPVLVGERGPELFVPRETGNIVSNEVLRSRRSARQVNNVNINIAVDGSVSGATADQIAVRTGAAVSRAMRRNA